MSVKKPRVLIRCQANKDTGPRERIVEFAGETLKQGGLISLKFTEDGRLWVDVYRVGPDVVVTVNQLREVGPGDPIGDPS